MPPKSSAPPPNRTPYVNHYARLCSPGKFYYLPVASLAHLVYPSELDTLDILCSYLNPSEASLAREALTVLEDPHWTAGTVEFLFSAEAAWQQADPVRLLPALISGPSYRAAKHRLRQRGELVDYDPRPQIDALVADLDAETAERIHRRLARELRPVRYALPQARHASQADVIFRPRAYLENRWPAWFTNRNWGEWAVCLALMSLWSDARRALGPRRHSLTIAATRDQIARRAFELLPAASRASGEHDRLTGSKIDSALDALFGIGLLNTDRAIPGAPGILHYTLDLAVFAQPPNPDLARLADHCGLEATRDAARLHLLQTLVRYSFVPARELRAVNDQIGRGLRGGRYGLATPEEIYRLAAHIRGRREAIRRQTAPLPEPGTPAQLPQLKRLGLNAWLADLAPQSTPGRRELVSATFMLSGRGMQVAPVSLATLRATSRGLDATQLLISFAGDPNLSVAEINRLAAACTVYAFQPGIPPAAGEAVCLGRCLLDVDRDLYIARPLDANRLHRFDYSRPFWVMLHTETPDRRLKFRCCFRLLVQTVPPSAGGG